MLTIYFSGTGNSEYIAKGFSKRTNALCHSIEEETKLDFSKLILSHETICFCYPIHSSSPVFTMREFVTRYEEELKGKKIIIFCTQMYFSGDGGKALARLLPNSDIIYSRQIDMPINISNVPFIRNRLHGSRCQIKSINKLLDKIAKEVLSGKKVLQGWSSYAEWLGSLQNRSAPKIEGLLKSSFSTNSECILCGLCVTQCPTKNLFIEDSEVKHVNQCACCFRCVNHCPKKAAQVMLKRAPRRQYKGFVI